MSAEIYVLRLVSDKYYVGKANDVDARFQKHVAGNGASWTKKYKPLDIVSRVPMESPFQEDMTVLEYMLRYGIDNVRGGSYSQVRLPVDTVFNIRKQLCHAENKCFKCLKVGHFVSQCPLSKKFVESVESKSDSSEKNKPLLEMSGDPDYIDCPEDYPDESVGRCDIICYNIFSFLYNRYGPR